MSKYIYKRPNGKYYRISQKDWNKVFARRGRWPLTQVDCYVDDERGVAVTQCVVSPLGKAFMWSLCWLHYAIAILIGGYKEAHKSFLDAVFDKQRGAFCTDTTYKYRYSGEDVTSDWIKLKKLTGHNS